LSNFRKKAAFFTSERLQSRLQALQQTPAQLVAYASDTTGLPEAASGTSYYLLPGDTILENGRVHLVIERYVGKPNRSYSPGYWID